jgi:acylphosphatase
MPSSSNGFRAVITGRVQGVFYRDFTRQRARELGLTGYVKNQPDGSVEVVALGEQAKLQRLVGYLNQGPPHASVSRVSVAWLDRPTPYADFEIRY